MRLTTPDGRFAMANFCQPSQYSVDIHLNSLVIRFFGSLSEKKSPLHIGCRKSESDTCKQPNINEEGKSRYRKSAVGCRKPHTCVRRPSRDLHTRLYKVCDNHLLPSFASWHMPQIGTKRKTEYFLIFILYRLHSRVSAKQIRKWK